MLLILGQSGTASVRNGFKSARPVNANPNQIKITSAEKRFAALISWKYTFVQCPQSGRKRKGSFSRLNYKSGPSATGPQAVMTFHHFCNDWRPPAAIQEQREAHTPSRFFPDKSPSVLALDLAESTSCLFGVSGKVPAAILPDYKIGRRLSNLGSFISGFRRPILNNFVKNRQSDKLTSYLLR